MRDTAHHFWSHGSSLSFAPCGTRFHHGQTSVMHLSVTVGVEKNEVVHAVVTTFRTPDEVMTVPSLDLGDRLVADGTHAPLFLPQMEQLPFPSEVGLHLDAQAFFEVDLPSGIIRISSSFDLCMPFDRHL
jgi:hypothetical protein